GRGAGGAVAHRVPAARLPHAAPGPGAHPGPAAGEPVGLGLRGAVADRRDLCQLPAPQARPARPAADPHPAGRGIHAAGAWWPAPMSGSGRLSLRSRLLVLLIAVTAAFLLIMGGVTTLVLTRRLTGQFNADLVAAAARNPQALAGNTNGYLAAAISRPPRRTGQTALLPPGQRGDELLQTLGQMSRPQFVRLLSGPQPFTLALPDGTRMRAVERLIRAGQVKTAALPPGVALLVVARPVT